MPSEPKFLLDANVFIEAKRRYYAFDLGSGFWNALIWHHQAGRIASIDRVKEELLDLADELQSWIQSDVPASFFESTDDAAVMANYAQMVAWVQANPQFFPEAKTEFASVADGWLAAYAQAKGLIVVTHEVLAPDAKRRVPLPNVCVQFGVEHIDTFEMLKRLGVKLSWNPPHS